MSLKNRINEDLKTALKSGDTAIVGTLRMLKAEIKNREIERRGELDDNDILAAVSNGVKKRRESAEMYEKGGRQDLADKEKLEMAVLLKYMPKQLSEDEIRQKVISHIRQLDSPGMKDMGRVMKTVMADIGKSADGGAVGRIVKELLQAQS